MPQDYAKKQRGHQGASRFDKRLKTHTTPKWIGLIAVVLVSVIAILGINLALDKTTDSPKIVVKKERPSAKFIYQKVEPEAADAGTFNFHNVLKTKTVDVAFELSKTAPLTSLNKRYTMQCGAFRQQTMANHLKVKIAMAGSVAAINPTKEKSLNLWYRVTLGPYISKRTAEQEKHKLEKNDINDCKIWTLKD